MHKNTHSQIHAQKVNKEMHKKIGEVGKEANKKRSGSLASQVVRKRKKVWTAENRMDNSDDSVLTATFVDRHQ